MGGYWSHNGQSVQMQGTWTNDSCVAIAQFQKLPVKLGSEAHLVPKGSFGLDGIRGEITSASPLIFRTSSFDVLLLTLGSSAVLVCLENGRLWRMVTDIVGVTCEAEQAMAELKLVRAQEIDRRRSPRFDVTIPVELGFVTIASGAPTYQTVGGISVNISETGARLKVESFIEPGTMMHVTFRLPSAVAVKALAISTHIDEGQTYLGVNFIEFVDESQNPFQEFIGYLVA